MYFKEGDNTRLTDRLENAVRDGRVSHAYIFEGDRRTDKRGFAESFAKGILCPERRGENCGRCSVCAKIDHGNHEDIIYVSADGQSIKDAQMTEVQEKIRVKPFGSRHIVIVEDSDTMTVRAQNRFLKTLEEPPGDTVIILLSDNMENLLPTIRSRCVKLRIEHSGGRDPRDGGNAASKGRDMLDMVLEKAPFYKMKSVIDKVVSNKEEEEFLDGMENAYEELMTADSEGIKLLKDEEIINGIHTVERARRQLREGVSPSYALKDLILRIGGQI